jgi:hypothetical protein
MKKSSTTGRTPRPPRMSEILPAVARIVNRTIDERLGQEASPGTAGQIKDTRTTIAAPRLSQGGLLNDLHIQMNDLEGALSELWARLEPVTVKENGAAPTPLNGTEVAGSDNSKIIQVAIGRVRALAYVVRHVTESLEV